MNGSLASHCVCLLLLCGCSAQTPEHCELPQLDSIPIGDPDNNEWWRPGSLPVSSTLDWEQCPPLGASTADLQAGPRITFPGRAATVAEGDWPVVLFGHANSVNVCNPSDRYRSLHEQWASWGWVVYSVDASEYNCQPYRVARMQERIGRHGEALEDLRRRNLDPSSPFFDRLNLDTIVAAGHSRGGTSAVVLLAEDDRYAGAIAMQAGNPSRFFLGEPFVDKPLLGITAELDTDLAFPEVDLTEELARGRYSWHTLRRGNHAYAADGLPAHIAASEGNISREAQIRQTKYLTTAFLAAEFGVWDGSKRIRIAAADDVLYTSSGSDFSRGAFSPGFTSRWNRGPEHATVWVDRFEAESGLETNELQLPNTCEIARCERVFTYNPDGRDPPGLGYEMASSLLLDAGPAPGRYTSQVGTPDAPLRLPRGFRLQARVRGTATFDVLLDTDSGEQRVSGPEALSVPELGPRFVQLDVPVEADGVVSVGFELEAGRLIVDDLRFVAP